MGIARSTYYDRPERPTDDTAIVEAMFEVCDVFESYGYRRVDTALRQRGLVVNHKKIRRLMREHDLQPKIRRRFIATTDSGHGWPIYPNLARDFLPMGPNQLWVSDITYVALPTRFIYAAIILDAWSRLVVGYAIGRSIDARLTTRGLASRYCPQAAAAWLHSPLGPRIARRIQAVVATPERRRLRWGLESDDHTVLDGRRCRHRDVRQWRGDLNSAILVGDSAGADQRRCCAGGWYVAACWNQIVPTGGRHGTSDVQIFHQAAVRAIPCVCGT
ncbi:hypothetical protein CK224_04365 [Mesorhizobium sp. WSM3862]|nr:hypothetical protein CK224_04365 [Mesorhizobium sp. WSM3862]